jgi:hypothetical protein
MILDSLYAKLLAIVLVAGGLIAVGWHLGGSSWRARYEALSAENWKGRAQQQQDRADELARQLRTAQETSANNATVIHDLQQQTLAAQGDRDLLRDRLQRLLADAARPGPAGHPVSQAGDRCPTAGTGEARGDGPALGAVTDAVADALAEARANARQLNALIDEIGPQL